MPAIINTNINSLNAQHNLARSQNKLSTALERLSSGLRINSAADDAAGLAIATRFTTQINGLRQAVRNANDGISLVQTAGSALAQVTSNLQRIRTLAVQSANATYTSSDRAAINQEVQQRIDEISRIANQTTFNGLHVLNGTEGSLAFQVGANVGDTISIDLTQGARAGQIGQIKVATVTGTAPTATPIDLTGAGNSLTIQVGDNSTTFSQSYADVNALAQSINDAGLGSVTATVNDAGTAGDATDDFLELKAFADVTISGNATAAGLSAATTAANLDGKHLSEANVLTVEAANTAIRRVDAALQSISAQRSELGAVQNRFESTVTNLQTVTQNLAAARSRIQDTDYAKATAQLAKAQILQQAGISVLSQANAAPQVVLKLLQ